MSNNRFFSFQEQNANGESYFKKFRTAVVASLMLSTIASVYASDDSFKSTSLPEPTTNTISVTQQTSKITGTVKDQSGEPLIGVSIVVKGTTTGTVTDFDGNFELNAKPGDVLHFSYIGYAPVDYKVTANKAANIVMKEDTKALDEVVVTALGMKRAEKALGYAVTELKGDELNTNSINPVSSLQGKVAGVEISGSDGGMFGSSKIQIRGASTLGKNNQPIYVIDGVILDNSTSSSGDADWNTNAADYGNELKNLNPDDFATVSVLKGAAATALYGSRGLNGAVVITTKSGKKGQGLGINFSQTFGIDHVFKTPGLQDLYGEGTMAGYINYGTLDQQGNYHTFDTNQFDLNSNGIPTLKSDKTSGVAWGPRFDGREIEYYDGSIRSYQPQSNRYKDAFKLGFNTNTNVAIQGGSEKTTFYTSLSYRHASGTLPNNSFDRVSFLSKGSHEITDRVKINASISFANSNPKNAQQNIGDFFAGGTFGTMYDSKFLQDKYLGSHGGVASTNYGDKYGYVPGNEVWFEMFKYSNTRKETSVRPTLGLEITLTDWLKFITEGNYNYYYIRGENKELGKGYANEGGFYSISNYTKEQTNLHGTFTANKQFGDWAVNGFVRGEYYNNIEQNQVSKTSGGLIVPGQYFIGNSKNTPDISAKMQGTKRMMSVAFQAGVSWKNQVFLDVTGRNDWSSALVYTNKTGNYSYFYPSVSGSWLLNETFKLPEWINLAKVRGSWAQVGNDTSPYRINQGYSIGSIQQATGMIYSLDIPWEAYDPSLRPERKNAWEIGLDWRFLNNRIGIDATYYRENTKDQIMSISVPSISGLKTQLINAGNIQNQGIEIALNTTPIRTKDWTWDLDFTYTKNDNKILSLHPNVAEYIELEGSPGYGNFRIGSVAMVGGSYGILMTDSNPKKNDKGQNILSWNDSQRVAYETRSGKVEAIGSITPDFLGSVSTNLAWKDLSLRVALDMRFGGYVASYNSRYGTAYGYTETSLRGRDAEHGGVSWISKYTSTNGQQYNDGIIPEGVFAEGTMVSMPGNEKQQVNVGGMTFQEAMDAGYVEPSHASTYHFKRNNWGLGVVNDDWYSKLSYIALREISLSYRMPSTIASKIGARSLMLGFAARNLGYLYNSLPNNENPETVRGTNAAEFRLRSYSPYTANYTFTINASF